MNEIREAPVLKIAVRDSRETSRRTDNRYLFAAFRQVVMLVEEVLDGGIGRAFGVSGLVDIRRTDVYEDILIRMRRELGVEGGGIHFVHDRWHEIQMLQRCEIDGEYRSDDDCSDRECQDERRARGAVTEVVHMHNYT